jgi:hypothetical protein
MLPFIFSPLSSLMEVEVFRTGSHCWAEIRLPRSAEHQAAFRVAAHIAWHRCGGAPQYFNAWFVRYQGGPPHDLALLDCVQAFLGSESIGTREEPAVDDHLEGFVAEHIWHLLTSEDVLTLGLPLRIDGPEWSVTDSGGDGLAVYRSGSALIFRLWESKSHTGEGPVRDVVNGACRQIDSNALRYLARFSKVGQSLTDSELQRFYGLMPQMWRDSAREAGGGISVSTASSIVDDCFGNFSAYWPFTHGDQRQGVVVAIDDFAAFAKLVREQLWKGL